MATYVGERFLGVALGDANVLAALTSSAVLFAAFAAIKTRSRHALTASWQAAAYRHALAVGFDRAFLVGAAISVLILVTVIAIIRVRRADLAGR